MAINLNLLLYIEPQKDPSEKPIIDKLTKRMVAAFRKAKRGVIEYDSCKDGKPFKGFHETFGAGWRGPHTCSCGAQSHCNDYLLPNGEVTNSLCVHYLVYHRDEISEIQLVRVNNLNCSEEDPNEEELNHPKIKEEIKKHNRIASRQKYKEMFETIKS